MLDNVFEDETLCEEIVRIVLEANPHLARGDKMTSPCNLVDANGEIATSMTPDMSMFKPITAHSVTVKFPLDESLSALKLDPSAKFLHVYQCLRRELKLGDRINVMNQETLEVEETVVNQELMDKFNVVFFRFATS